MKKLVSLISIFLIVAFYSMVFGQEKPAPTKSPEALAPEKKVKPAIKKFSGVIEKIDEAAKTIDVKMKTKKAEKVLTFVVTPETKITRGKEIIAFGDLKQNINVSLEYKQDGDKLTAISIKIAIPKAPPQKEKKPEEPKK